MQSVTSDERFDRHFRGRLIQVFLYITDECNLRCSQCYYKPSLRKRDAEMPTDVVLGLLEHFRKLGALKVSFLGGEPTLYGRTGPNEPFPMLAEAAKRIGFEYVRVVTNGLFDEALLQDRRLSALDEITFSLDGDTAEVHEKLRGRRTFERALVHLRQAVALGQRVHLTMCAHRGNIGRTPNGELLLSRAISWAAALGVKSFNIHPLIKMGVARDDWTGASDLDPAEWLAVYRDLDRARKTNAFPIPVRMPLRYGSPAQFDSRPNYYGYCSVKHADRLDVHPNGQMHTCSLHNSSSIAVARFETGPEGVRIRWADEGNEIAAYDFREGEHQHCAIMKRLPEGLRPLCVSLKPGQEEFAWKHLGLEAI